MYSNAGIDFQARKRMPLLDWIVKSYGSGKPLAGWNILFIQHQLENHLAQAEALFECGMEASRLYWIDIPYTSSTIIRNRLIEHYRVPAKQFKVHNYDLTQIYSTYQRVRVVSWIRDYLSGHCAKEPLLVLDDGGYFLEALVCLKSHPKKLCLVEQTTRGINKMRENDAIRYYFNHIPVVDVATSPIKKKLETPFIAHAVCESLHARLQVLLKQHVISLSDARVLVLGYGDIGSAVSSELEQHFQIEKNRIYIYDTNKVKCSKAEKIGFNIWQKAVNNVKFRLVVGCTGKSSFKIWDYVHLEKEAVLISASSGSTEMAREGFVEWADSTNLDDIFLEDRDKLKGQNIHHDIRLNLVNHRVTIANGGFPINFDQHLNRIRPEDIQITVAAMVFGAIQATEALLSGQEGIQLLDRAFCRKARSRFKKMLENNHSRNEKIRKKNHISSH